MWHRGFDHEQNVVALAVAIVAIAVGGRLFYQEPQGLGGHRRPDPANPQPFRSTAGLGAWARNYVLEHLDSEASSDTFGVPPLGLMVPAVLWPTSKLR
jgi:hypothetical protein